MLAEQCPYDAFVAAAAAVFAVLNAVPMHCCAVLCYVCAVRRCCFVWLCYGCAQAVLCVALPCCPCAVRVDLPSCRRRALLMLRCAHAMRCNVVACAVGMLWRVLMLSSSCAVAMLWRASCCAAAMLWLMLMLMPCSCCAHAVLMLCSCCAVTYAATTVSQGCSYTCFCVQMLPLRIVTGCRTLPFDGSSPGMPHHTAATLPPVSHQPTVWRGSQNGVTTPLPISRAHRPDWIGRLRSIK
eukprot:COSAG02_NODE_343_length_24147_cov_30.662051_10_plen_240_part_00